MVQLTQLYKSVDDFKKYLVSNNFDLSEECLVRFFTSSLNEEQIKQVVSDVKQLLPNSEIVGASSCSAVIYESDQHEGESVIIVNTFTKIKVKTKLFSWIGKNAKGVLNEIKEDFGKNKDMVNVIFSNTDGDLYDIIDEFVHYTNMLSPFIKFVGGVAGDVNGESYVFTQDGIEKNGVVLFSYTTDHNIRGVKPNYFTHTSIAADEISDIHEVTKVDGKIILEIDNTPAVEWFYDFLEVEQEENISLADFKANANNAHFTGFSIISNKHNSNSRCLKYDTDIDRLSLFSSKMSNGSKFKVGYLSPRKIISQSYVLCGNILLENIESIFVYSCFARKSYLDKSAKLELTPLAQNDVSGVFFLGEICNQGDKNNLYNASCCMIGIAEDDNYAHVDTTPLEQNSIESDLRFYKKALRKKDQIGTIEDTSDSKFYDADLNMPNLLKYEYDLSKNLFNKIVVFEVLTADSTIAYASHEKYVETLKDIFLYFDNLIDSSDMSEYISTYMLNYKTYIITGTSAITDEKFVDIMKKVYSKLGFFTSDKTHISSVLRFVVVVNQSDMLKVGTAALYSNKSSQENFIISENNKVEEDNILVEEGFYLGLLKRAIDHNMVIPHYQGMRNNKTNKIDKYESLMRIEENGQTYHPDLFLDIAKKFKLYSQISEQMIKKVLDEFQDRDESIIINMSFYDIEVPAFKEWIIDKLKSYRRPERIIIEFTQTEEGNDLGLIRDFVQTVRDIGGKINIVELGLGYSAFAAIVNTGKDFTSLDTNFVREISTNEINSRVLNTISYLASSMDIKTIAEFVDNASIQALVDENEVNSSQGFSFSDTF